MAVNGWVFYFLFTIKRLSKKSKCKRFVRAIYENGRVRLPAGGNTAGMIASMKDCNCLIEIEPGKNGYIKGDMVNIFLL